MPMLRVSAAAWTELKRRAFEQQRPMGAILEALLLPPTTPAARAPATVPVPVPDRCPHCGCSVLMHGAGSNEDRCERHPTCRWRH